ncbi:class I SAM-dependent methyltransferase [Rhodocytophaga rosea]|uniref:Class I SAM-dependent methyltransferase n=2 Tax=Rhodocytophaga rosea TaxID=2704465 RepID=A0A6C0GXQ0_9BACT|nr:class I SAM-dependent methyltransferase [Rhodocytophaga rosea]
MMTTLSTQVQSAYEKQYEDNQAEWREMGARKKALNILELTQGLKFRSVLEVGAGDGSILQQLSEHRFADELYAVEISGSALQRIQHRNISQLKQSVLFDGYTIPFENNSFDLVILSHVLEHVEFERRLLRELMRVAPVQLIEVPKDYRFGVDKKVKHFLSYGHINMYTPSSLRFLLKSEGFTIMKEKVDLYSRETYQFMYSKPAVEKKSATTSIKADGLYLFKKLLLSIPFPQVRDHFANTITVLTSSGKENIDIF